MRKLFTLSLLLITSCLTAYCAPKIKLKVNNGKWASSNWDLGRVPSNNDTIVIPTNMTLTLDQSVVLDNVVLEIYGKLSLDGNSMMLTLNNTSKVLVYLGGRIEGSKNSQHIKLNNVIYKGNEVISGPMMANGSTGGFIEMPMPAPIPLPVKFIGFSAARKNADVLVQWATAQELNADYYEVQRSEDGKNWRAIGNVTAAGTTNSTTTYSYIDNNIAQKTVYYRIRQVDFDGRFEYTAIRTVKSNNNTTEVNATAARGNIVLQFSKQAIGQVEVRLVSLSGQVVSRQLLNRPAGQLVIPAAVRGNYILTVSDQQDIQINKQVLL